MACTEILRLGDMGTTFRATIVDKNGTIQDVSSATQKDLIFKQPDGLVSSKSALFYTDGSDGVIYYTTVSGDINQVGRWEFEAYIVTPSGNWYSDIGEFLVKHSLVS